MQQQQQQQIQLNDSLQPIANLEFPQQRKL
jgi:hypothetical protein